MTDRIRMYADEFQQHLSAKLMGYEYSEHRKLSEQQLEAARSLYTYGLTMVLEQMKKDAEEELAYTFAYTAPRPDNSLSTEWDAGASAALEAVFDMLEEGEADAND